MMANEEFKMIDLHEDNMDQLCKNKEGLVVANYVKLLAQHLYKAQYDSDYVCEDEAMVSQGYGV